MIYSYCWIFCERNEDCCLKVMKTLFFFSAALISQFKVSNLFKTLLRTVSVIEPTAVWAILLRSISIFDINVVHFLTSFCSEIDHLEVRFNMLNQSSNKGLLKNNLFKHVTEILKSVNQGAYSFTDKCHEWEWG